MLLLSVPLTARAHRPTAVYGAKCSSCCGVERGSTGGVSAPTLQGVWLLKRELARGAESAVLDSFQCAEFDGTTLTDTPAWGGPFAVDVVACVAEPSGGTFWIKAQNRSVQVCSCAIFWFFCRSSTRLTLCCSLAC